MRILLAVGTVAFIHGLDCAFFDGAALTVPVYQSGITPVDAAMNLAYIAAELCWVVSIVGLALLRRWRLGTNALGAILSLSILIACTLVFGTGSWLQHGFLMRAALATVDIGIPLAFLICIARMADDEPDAQTVSA